MSTVGQPEFIEPSGTLGHSGPVLEVEGLSVEYRFGPTWHTAVSDVSFTIGGGDAVGLVGESGCGKSTIAMAIMGHLPRNGRIAEGQIRFRGRDMSLFGDEDRRQMLANELSIVYQDPATTLNPSMRIGRQVGEVYALMGEDRSVIADLVRDVLEMVQIADPDVVATRYPHQLSGGMLQRVVIAMAIAKGPELLILDEPTTGLDATVEAEVLDLVDQLRNESRTAVLFVSHNLGVIERMCDHTAVLYAGRLAEIGPSSAIFSSPRHPYTMGLLRSLPSGAQHRQQQLQTIPGFLPPIGATTEGCVFADRCAIKREVCGHVQPPALDVGSRRFSWCHFPDEVEHMPRPETATITGSTPGEALVEIRGAAKTFDDGRLPVHAVAGVDLSIADGETVALVGESGSGKSTLAKLILGIHEPDAGTEMLLEGAPLAGSIADRSGEEVQAIQIIFQNPDAALNRRHSVRRIIGRAVSRLRGDRDPSGRVSELTQSVRMGEQTLGVRPAQLSGGLKQRVAIARAFAGAPRLVVADEPTSALDVSVQAAILNLLRELQEESRVSYLFISHDLNVVRHIADRIAVMYLGRILEEGPTDVIFGGPTHPYTEALLSSSPEHGADRRIRLEGEIPSPSDVPSGCAFHSRCQHKLDGDICERSQPPLIAVDDRGHRMRCHIPFETLVELQTPAPIDVDTIFAPPDGDRIEEIDGPE